MEQADVKTVPSGTPKAAGRVPKEPRRVIQRRYEQKIKQKVWDHYGAGRCACCGATEDLSIDHVNGDGAEHREQLYGSKRIGGGYRFYLWLIHNDYPPGFQVLCRPCNHSKRRAGRCRLVHGGPPGFKRCTHPRHEGDEPLPLDSFHRNKSAPGGRMSRCKDCECRFDDRPRKTKPTPAERNAAA